MQHSPTVLLVAALLLLGGVGPAVRPDATAGAPTEIDSCTTITESGTYVLAADLENVAAAGCLEIRASDVRIEGRGHRIDGNWEQGALADAARAFLFERYSLADPRLANAGIAVGAPAPLSNVTVANVTVTDWFVGVFTGDATDVSIRGVTASENGFGVLQLYSENGSVSDSALTGNAGNGYYGLASPNATVSNATASGNRFAGIYVGGSDGAQVANSTADRNAFAGVLVAGSDGVRLTDSDAAGNDVTGIYLYFSADGRVVGSTADRNDQIGVYLRNATNTTVRASGASDNGQYGVVVQNSTATSIVETTVRRNVAGVVLDNSTRTNLTRNDIVANERANVLQVPDTAESGPSPEPTSTPNVTSTPSESTARGTTATATTTASAATPPDPAEDVIGWENGYWYNESIDVNQSDGLSPSELDAFVSRGMARIEFLRKLEFTSDVDVEAMTREEYVTSPAFGSNGSAEYWDYVNQFWEALFISGEGTNVSDEFETLYQVGVGGFYDPRTDKLVVISETPETPTLNGSTLIHELYHALQDQQFDLRRPELNAKTYDRSKGITGLVEGDAVYTQALYRERCRTNWSCVGDAESDRSAYGTFQIANPGLDLIFEEPYSDGQWYVRQVAADGGLDAVYERYRNPPPSSEQILHPARDDEPLPMSFTDTARNGWKPLAAGASGGPLNTTGELAIYAMFATQSAYGNDVINVSNYFRGAADDVSVRPNFNYTSAPSAGWGNDTFVPYENDGRYGYVWVTKWDTERDAAQFYDAYLDVLAGQGARQRGDHTWVVPDGQFADAFRVTRGNDTVTVVNAPTVRGLGEIRPRNGTTSADADRTS